MTVTENNNEEIEESDGDLKAYLDLYGLTNETSMDYQVSSFSSHKTLNNMPLMVQSAANKSSTTSGN